jgi:hypothetical protein
MVADIIAVDSGTGSTTGVAEPMIAKGERLQLDRHALNAP